MGRAIFINANLLDGDHPAKTGSTVVTSRDRIMSVGIGRSPIWPPMIA
jgi:hypothetical protein